MMRIPLLILAMSTMLAAHSATSADAQGWTVESPSPDSSYGLRTAIAVGPDGTPHLVSNDPRRTGESPAEGIHYFYKDGGVWIDELVDHRAWEEGEIDIEVDANGIPHIVYHVIALGEPGDVQGIMYARRDGGVWTKQMVDTLFGDINALALDSEGNPHVAWYSACQCLGHGQVSYAKRIGGSWIKEIVQTLSSVGNQSISLILDSGDRPHLAYARGGFQILYATKSAGLWDVETVAAGGDFSDAAITLLPDQSPVISFYDQDNDSISSRGLRVAHKVGAVWSMPLVDQQVSSRRIGDSNAIVSDSTGAVQVVYHYSENSPQGSLHAVRRASSDDLATWSFDFVVEPTLDAQLGMNNDVALDAQGNPHVSFTRDFLELRYAYLNNTIAVGDASDVSRLWLAASPNPSSGGRFRIQFGSAAGESLQLTIHDLRGRLVRSWNDLSGPAASVLWNGTDRGGRRVPIGVYWATLSDQGERIGQKLVTVR